ncbi:ExeM/NucH family extracellular endonuclease [Nocardioides panaciterrulae]|uniref:Putative extracellular nuclease n=1 Tax=Nocardioides panaciterrulae TaxID=661492 RepID=A0A7Y9E6M4_9ACTN|nr:ExeM/NucH family extracellular endonuclease [Nocardioides panaciterrulae]NYD42178.1 putative extracellular nuclease [Nocardioides panaciterrulae]
MPSPRKITAVLGGFALVSSGVALAATAPAVASTDGTGLVISEAYGGGGNSGATLKNDFVELYNPTSAPISVEGLSIQYRSSGSANPASGVTELHGSVPAGGHYLVEEAAGAGGTTDLPTPDATGTTAMSGSAFTVWLAEGTAALNPPTGDAAGTTGVVDLVGVNSNTFEGAKTGGVSSTASAQRAAAGTDTDVNSADFTITAPTPESSNGDGGAGGGGGGDTGTPVDATIAEIQGTGSSSPLAGKDVTTVGVVTAAYPSGGFYGYVIQTQGTGGADDATPGASDGVYVYQPSGAVTVQPGDYVQVTGSVSEYGGLTELTVPATGVTELSAAHQEVTALKGDLPTTDAGREAHESELLDLSGQHFTVTDNYTTNQYAEIGLATGDTPLITPTEMADAQDAAAVAAVEADNAARAITLDDGSSTNFLPYGGGDNQDIPLPWLGTDNPVRVSSAATFHQPVVLDYRNKTWKLQPTHQVTDEGKDVVTFSDTRSENAAPQDVGGDLKLATFNVLNYFPTTGEEYVAAGGSCTYYEDRDGDPVTDRDCGESGPRGAAQAEDLKRQQDKIVAAINTMDADIVSLEEIENSVKFGKDRDYALSTLVDALNQAAGTTRWAYVPSPAASDLPPLDEQDVIRTAFIYNPATVQPVGDSEVLVGSAAFYDAREPLAQAFRPAGANDDTTFGVIVNHFKSKGSGTDDHTGQGNANPDRVAQAHDLLTFADKFEADRGIDTLFMTGDYNAYSMEDPVQVLEDGGFTNLQSDQADEWTYDFGGMVGSLDHVFANAAAFADVTGVDIWNINADEAVAFEYSRDNYNATDFYQANQFRASDHDPEIVGIDIPGFPAEGTLHAKATPRTVTAGRTRVKVHVDVRSASGATPTGTVQVVADGKTYTVELDHAGRARVRLDPFASAGTQTVEVSYLGDSETGPSSTSVQVEVLSQPGHGHGAGHGHHGGRHGHHGGSHGHHGGHGR